MDEAGGMTEAAKAGSLLEALLAVQAEAPTLPKDATNPHFRSKYTPLDTIVKMIGPLLAKQGLVWTTLPGREERGELVLEYRLVYAPTGETLEGTMPLLVTQETPQGLGSALTYARRYALSSVLNLVSDDDDDGHNAQPAPRPAQTSQREPASVAQRQLLGRLRREKGLTRPMLGPILIGLGLDGFALEPGWTEKLSKHQASRLIEALKELPSVELPTSASDVPGAGPGEFIHPGSQVPDE